MAIASATMVGIERMSWTTKILIDIFNPVRRVRLKRTVVDKCTLAKREREVNVHLQNLVTKNRLKHIPPSQNNRIYQLL